MHANRTDDSLAMPEGQGPLLAARGLNAGYDRSPILHDVSFEAPRGEITALVGPNGCGKSTLLKVLARLIRPSAGDVQLDGSNLHGLPTRSVARRLALLPQGPVAPEGLTVRELVRQGRYPHQTLLSQWSAEDARAVEAAMADTEITDLADRPVANLSGGQRQRCWISMVLAQETELILLDEPTTFLDLKVQIDVMTLLRRIATEHGRTLVVVLHELNLAAAFADRIVMMRDGRIRASGSAEAVMTEAALAEVFDLDARIIHDPESGRPVCLPRTLPRTPAAQAAAE